MIDNNGTKEKTKGVGIQKGVGISGIKHIGMCDRRMKRERKVSKVCIAVDICARFRFRQRGEDPWHGRR